MNTFDYRKYNMNILDYRKQFPGLQPYTLCKYKDKYMECISWAFEENNENYIFIREPNDSTTLQQVKVEELTLLKAICRYCGCEFPPKVSCDHGIICPKCYKNYFILDIGNEKFHGLKII